MKSLFVFLASLLVASVSHADDAFEELAHEVNTACSLGISRCDSPYYAIRYAGADLGDVRGYDRLKRIANDNAQIWGDTILEGPYSSIGKLRIDEIVVVKRGNRTVLYYVTYSERAIYTEGNSCVYDDATETYSGCPKGRIIESAMISADFKHSVNREGDITDFHED